MAGLESERIVCMHQEMFGKYLGTVMTVECLPSCFTMQLMHVRTDSICTCLCGRQH
jgi:hypothetical protein